MEKKLNIKSLFCWHLMVGLKKFGISKVTHHTVTVFRQWGNQMALSQRSSIVVILSMLYCLFAVCGSAGAQPLSNLKLNTHQIPWTNLSFHAKNFWVEVSTQIQLKSLRASDLDTVLLATSKGIPVKPKTPQVTEMSINTTINPRLRSPVKIHNRIWFNPTDASALGRVRLRRGEDDFKKMYRFTEQGVFRHRIEPKDEKEAKLEPDKWTDIKDTFYPFDISQMGCPVVSERSVLIYLLSTAAMSKNDTPLSICVFGKRQLHRVQIRKEGTLPIKINYIEKSRQVKIRKEGTVKAVKMAITAQPIEPHLEEVENFSFLGFHKDIILYLDPHSGLPLQASGIIPTVGEAHLKLLECQTQSQTN